MAGFPFCCYFTKQKSVELVNTFSTLNKTEAYYPNFGVEIHFVFTSPPNSFVIFRHLFKLKGEPGFYPYCFCQKTNCLLKLRKVLLKTWCWAKNPDGIILPFSNKKSKAHNSKQLKVIAQWQESLLATFNWERRDRRALVACNLPKLTLLA